jgi:hypothetical protein
MKRDFPATPVQMAPMAAEAGPSKKNTSNQETGGVFFQFTGE